MASEKSKSVDQLMEQVIWTRKEASRVLRIDPRTLNRYLFHPEPKRRLPSLHIGNCVRVERDKVLLYFRTKVRSTESLVKG
jgi:hypothetical protein